MKTITAHAAVADPRFPVLAGPEGDDLREFLDDREGDDTVPAPRLPTGWRWSGDGPLLLEIPKRWRVEAGGDRDEHDQRPGPEELWDWVTPGEATARHHCAVIDTWTGEEHHETHTVEPDEPQCIDGGHRHGWGSPIEIVGGIKDNPGVHGKGGGVLIHEVCRRCGHHRHTDTWATDGQTGEEGLRSVSYTQPDAASEAYAAASRLMDAARLESRGGIADAVADVDPALQLSVSVEDAVAAGICRSGAERWIGRHGRITLDQVGRVLHRLGKSERIELAESMARILMSRAAQAGPA